MLDKSLLGRRILNFAIFYFVTLNDDTQLSTHQQTEAANLRTAFGPTQTTKRVTRKVLTDKKP
jgi:hypothetical protein